MYLSLIIGAVVLILAWDFFRKLQRSVILKRSQISGPPTIPVLGNVLQALSLGPDNYIHFFGDNFNKYGKTFRTWIMGECMIYTKDLKYFEAILSSSTLLEKAQLYRFMREVLGDGLILRTGCKWASRRKVLTPAFHFKCLENFVEIMDRNSGIMVEKLREVADENTPVDLSKYVYLAALDVITEAAMGVRVNAQNDPNCVYSKAVKSVVSIESNRLSSVTQRYNWLFPLAAPLVYRRLQRGIRIMKDFTNKVIRERRAILERSRADQPLSLDDDNIGRKSKMTLLDILLQATIDNKPLTDEDIREEATTFILGGDDTTTSGVSHALRVISRHPEVQKCVYEELLAVLGQDPNTPVTQSQLLDLKYLDCVIKETMRLHPPVPILGRYIPVDLHVGDKTIPGNTSIALMPYYVYRDPEYFPDPLTFKPERWMNGKEASLASFAYIPFSSGPKNCIGKKFANLEMKTFISKVIRHFELFPLGEELRATYTFVLSSSSGYNVGLRPRKTIK